MNVGIVGSSSAVKRHVCVVEKINNVNIAGNWPVKINPDAAIDEATGMPVCTDKIFGITDALIITDPGEFSFDLATMAVRNAKHVFLYPHVMKTPNDAFQLMKLGNEANVVLKCGRTGKQGINSLLKSITDLKLINMIEFQHSVNISEGQIHDLHDILLGDMEIVSRLIHARNTSVKAKGICMLSNKPDVLNARLEFDNGAAINYYCNTVSMQNEHCMTLVLKKGVLQYNLINNTLSGWHQNGSDGTGGNPVFINNSTLETTDYLYEDLSSFFTIIQSRTPFHSFHDNGFESFILTNRILEKVSKTLVQFA